jgi:hypothetical protein
LPGRICSGQFDDKTICILSPRFLSVCSRIT